jgi:hypothetical protein
MRLSSKTLLWFGFYLVGMGASFVLAPNLVLAPFGLPATNEVWIRVVGVLALILAFYYIQVARHELQAFVQWSVYVRASVIVFFSAFVLAGLVSPILIGFGVVDLVAALATAWALRAEKQQRPVTAS